ncbi:MAG: hypothetical protein RL215_2058 [Planctomycetota bacterium]
MLCKQRLMLSAGGRLEQQREEQHSQQRVAGRGHGEIHSRAAICLQSGRIRVAQQVTSK